MSSPSDRDLGPLLYAPKWVRDDQRVQEVIKEIQELIEPGFHRPSPTSPVGGSVPRSLEPTLMSEVRPGPRRRSGVLVCLLLVVAAIAAPFTASKFPTEGIATAEERSNETPSFETRFWDQDSNIAERPRPPSPQLRELRANPGTPRNQSEGSPLAVTVTGAAVGASVVVDGLATGSTLTAGLPLGTNAWRLAASDLHNTFVRPPEGFVGAMDVVLELRLVDDTVSDRKPLRLEWAPGAPKQSTGYPIRELDPEEVADLIGRGEKFIKTGDLASARLVLQRAAEAGDQRAAMMLAGTFDPIVLEKIGIQGFAPDIIRGFAPDIALARTWYEVAKQFGSREATRRLEMLASRRGF